MNLSVENQTYVKEALRNTLDGVVFMIHEIKREGNHSTLATDDVPSERPQHYNYFTPYYNGNYKKNE